jgi:hypothetical protein
MGFTNGISYSSNGEGKFVPDMPIQHRRKSKA